MTYEVILSKQRFKFSAAHLTIFSKDQAESLHGHNYQIHAKLLFEKTSELGLAVPVEKIKNDLDLLCQQLDEKILLARANPFSEIKEENEGYWFLFSTKKYFFPKEDVVLLPLTNISMEELAQYLLSQLKKSWQGLPQILRLRLSVQETEGQSIEVSEDLK